LESRTIFTDTLPSAKLLLRLLECVTNGFGKRGVINGEVMLINPHCLGYQHIVDLCLTNAIEDDLEVTKFLETKPYIAGLVGPWGNYNFLGKVALRDLKKLQDIIEEFEANRYIKHADALIWAKAANIEYPKT
jgi:hypothetical protein